MKLKVLRWILFLLVGIGLVWLIISQPDTQKLNSYIVIIGGSLVLGLVGSLAAPVLARYTSWFQQLLFDPAVPGKLKPNVLRWLIVLPVSISLAWLILSQAGAPKVSPDVAVIAGGLVLVLIGTLAAPTFTPYGPQVKHWLRAGAIKKIKALSLLLAALVLMYIGQIQIFRDPPGVSVSSGLCLMLAGIGLFVIALNGAFPTDDALLTTVENVEPVHIRWRWLALSIGLFGFVAWRSLDHPQQGYLGEHLLYWGMAIASLLVSLSPKSGQRPIVDTRPLHRNEYLLLIGLFVAALLIRGIALDKVPPGLDTDEADYTEEAVKLYQAHFLFTPFEPGILSQPRFYQGMISISVALFGQNLWGARIPSVLLGALTIPFFYLLGRELRNWRTGLIAALFLLTWTLHIQFSRLALNLPGDVLLSAIAFYFLLRGLRLGSVRDYALAGVAIGIAQLFWLGARLLPLVIIAYLFYLWLRQRKLINSQWRLILVMALAAFLVSLPQNIYLVHYQLPVSVIAGVNIFLGGEFQRIVDSGANVSQYVLMQVHNSFLALFVVGDKRQWYGPGSNLMGPFGGPLLLIGVAMSLFLLWKYPKLSLPFGWALAVIVGGSTLSIDPPSYERYFPGALAFALLVEMGLSTVGFGVGKILDYPGLASKIALGLGGIVCLANLIFYVADYVPSGMALGRYLNWRDNLVAEQMVAAYEAGEQIILVGGWDTTVQESPLIRYFMLGKKYIYGKDELEPILSQVTPDKPFAFIVAVQRKADLDTVMKRFPGGTIREVYFPHNQQLSLYIYEKK